MNNIFAEEYSQFITTGVYFSLDPNPLSESDLLIFRKEIADWCDKNGLIADSTIDGDKILVRVGHFSEDAGVGIQMSIFQDIARPVGRIINKSLGFDIKETLKNPLIDDRPKFA